jgi:hypothetical protein
VGDERATVESVGFGPWGDALAVLSRDRRHRFRLLRTWDPNLPRCAFVMLNPSSADAHRLDPTNRRCLGFARAWGFGSLDVVNLFSLRTADPAELRRSSRPSRPINAAFLRTAAVEADLIVVGWGTNGAFRGAERAAVNGPLAGHPLFAVRTTRHGHPGHPLYAPGTATPTRWTRGEELPGDERVVPGPSVAGQPLTDDHGH